MSGGPPPNRGGGSGGPSSAEMDHPDLVDLERRLHSEVDEDFFQDPKKFRTLHRVIDILGMQLLDSADGQQQQQQQQARQASSADFDSIHRNNPAYVALKQQQVIVDEAIEHMAVYHCSDLNSSVVAVGKVSRQFNDASNRVRTLRRQVRDIKDSLGTGDSAADGDANPNEPAGATAVGRNGTAQAGPDANGTAGGGGFGGGMSLRELWLKKLECEAVLSLLHKLEKIRRAPPTFDVLVQPQPPSPCRIGSAVAVLTDALRTMFSDDVAQVQALHKIMEQLMTRKQRAEEIVWETLGDVIYLRTGNAVLPGELEQGGGVLASDHKKHHYVSGEPALRRGRSLGTASSSSTTIREDKSGNSGNDGDDSDVDSVLSDVDYDSGRDGSRTTAAAPGGGDIVGGRTIPRTILDSEVDLEADELRCLEETSASDFAIPQYADPVLALRILTEALARLGRLEDIERVLGETVGRELRRITQAEQARTFARLERRRNAGGGRRGIGGAAEGIDGNMGQLAEADEAMRDFRIHLSNLLFAFGSVALRLSHLAQIVRHKIMTDPQLTGRYSDPSSAMHSVLVAADTLIQQEVKCFLEACLNESEGDNFMYDGMAEEGRGASSHERGIFSLGIITDTASNKDSRSAALTSRANIVELSTDKFVTNVLFARSNMIPQVRNALTFRRSVATWAAESADLKAELAFMTGEDTTSPSYNANPKERAIDYLDSVIQKNLLPMLQEEAVNGTISALEREDAFEPRIDPAMYARAANSKNVQVEMCVACQALYRYTGPLFSALHRLPKGGEMYSPLVAVLEHAVLTFNSRVKQRVGQICRGKKASALLDANTTFFSDIELRRSYTQLMQAYFGEDDAYAAGASAALDGGSMPISPSAGKSKIKEEKSSGFDAAADYERERSAFEMEVSHLSPLLEFSSKNYGHDLAVCNDDELGRAACLAHSLLNVASLLEARLKTRSGGRDKTAGATRALRGSIKEIREHGVRMAKFCRVEMLIQSVKRMSQICASSTLTAKDAVRLPSCVNDLGEHLTSASDVLREAGGNIIAAYSLSSLEQYIPLFLMQTVRIIAQGKGRKNRSIITLNGVESLDRSGSVLYRDLKGATNFENSFWDDELAAESFERSASFIAMIELDMEELVSYCRNNRGEFSDEDYKLMFSMDGPRRSADIRKFATIDK